MRRTRYTKADWIKLETRDAPSPRESAAMAYDAVRANVVLFGGFNGSQGSFGDTWIFDGSNWTKVDPIRGPSGRQTHNLCWCPCSEQLVLVTGVRSSPERGQEPITGGGVWWSQQNLDDTWLFDGKNWQELRQSRYPNYAHHASATELQSGHVVTFGGIIAAPKTIIGVFFPRERRDSPFIDETWIFDGKNWQRIDPKARPAHRHAGAMSSYPGERGVLLFGGHGGDGKSHLLSDTWLFDGKSWQELHPPTTPSPRYRACMTYDAMSGEVVLFGGYGGGEKDCVFSDTWLFDGKNWQELHPRTAPSPRREACMTYDAMSGEVVLFGGYGQNGYLDDTWVLALGE